jgi:protein-glutamine gamma-glutamyltransferase
MAVLLRVRGIPSRVITGFQDSGDTSVNGWRIIRASDAHSWVEAYLPDHGWMVFDPTPADPNAGNPSLLSQITRAWDAMEVFWSDWVVSYDLERQIVLAARMQRTSRGTGSQWLDAIASGASWFQEDFLRELKKRALPVTVIVITVVLVIYFGPGLWRDTYARWRVRRIRSATRAVAANDATVLYERMLALLRKRGIEKPSWLTPIEFARIIPEPAVASVVSDFTEAYLQLRYGGDRRAVDRMFQLMTRLEQPAVRR